MISIKSNVKASVTAQKSPIVVKIGGSILKTDENLDQIVQQVCQLVKLGFRLALVHGGGSHITQFLAENGIESKFYNGLRITDEAALMAAYAALGHVNAKITDALKANGISAIGLHAEPKLFSCDKLEFQIANGATMDLGWVGQVNDVDASCFEKNDASVFVISPIGWDGYQNRYNINADDAALALAVALEADSLVFASDVPGVLLDGGSSPCVVASLDCDSALNLIHTGKVTGGMIPKLVSSVNAIKSGVKKVCIISGKKSTALLDLLLGKTGIGTTILEECALYGPARCSFEEPEMLKQIA